MAKGNRFNVRLPHTEDPAVKAVEAQHVKELAEQDYEAQVVAEALPVALDFYAKDSKACELLGPRFAAVAEKFAGKVRFLKVSRAAAAKLAAKLGVTGCPTIVFLQGGEEKGERLTGEDIKRTDLKLRVEGLIGFTAAPASTPAAT
jgi:thioredoxin-like negative regulator of GroEL